MNIQLVPFTEQDFEQLIEWSGDQAFLMQWAGPLFQYPLSPDQLFAYNRDANNEETSVKLNYRVVLTETQQSIGHISIGSIDRENASARITKVIIGLPDLRGKGIGKAMVETALSICFGKLGLHKVSLGVYDFNITAVKAYERVGFSIDGVLRDARKVGDTYWNLIEMSILEDEWKALQSDL
ncbi:acetyltransferase, ribosomal protein N-acetylase [Sphaerochaeta pleomorpha str. Grapes]|uniref:Acetyltransferase, ribosomal protein N-acetylase n=1 Tax=Sphaerochaeta pleomorpha (strain ATCC BAA-1885 / DSM 22778 / Grapes) TaxID=158190 RepID=G8QVY0_SPHPG|nr:GNAT family protein [Sphaerochaeta pleomorpha]AEV30504.1 acetyltransferase, ribosomal protein N-acetylase [Sphaerochaeta pleomorpha str. Grapes]